MNEYQEQKDYEALNADTAMQLNKAQQRIRELEAYKAAWSVNIMTKRIEELVSKLEAIRSYVEKHAGDGIDGDHVTWFKAAIGEREE